MENNTDVTRKQAEKFAQSFLSERNPTNWDGYGKRPSEFNKTCCTYDFGSPYVVLDIYFEYSPEERAWGHVCEIVDKESSSGTVGIRERLSGYGTNSYLNIADTILDICNTYDWFCD